MLDPRPSVAVVTDADACLPAPLSDRLGIVAVPSDASLYDPSEHPARLREQQGPLPAAALVASLLRISSRIAPEGSLLYIASGDGYSVDTDATGEIRAALAASRPDLQLVVHDSGSSLMGCGWQAVAAASALQAADGDVRAAVRAAERVRAAAEVRVMVEHPPFVGLGSGLANVRAARAVVALLGAEVVSLDRPSRRDLALVALRDRVQESLLQPDGRAPALDSGAQLWLAVVHAGADAAAGALAVWAERVLHPAELVVAPMTRHAATRLGPGAIALCWVRV